MPLYEYRCAECGEKFEIRRSMFADSDDKPVCPECGAANTERVFSPFSTASSGGSTCSSAPTGHFG